MHPRAAELIAILDLRPHPEGGFYRQVFRSAVQITPTDGRGPRAALTTIYFLLPEVASAAGIRSHRTRSGISMRVARWNCWNSVLRVSSFCGTGWAQSETAPTHRFAPSLPGFGKRRGRSASMRSWAAQLVRGSTSRTFACSQMIMHKLLSSERHCPIWQCSFEIETRGCRYFYFAAPYWLGDYFSERGKKSFHLGFFSNC
jgi:hypothetical protein